LRAFLKDLKKICSCIGNIQKNNLILCIFLPQPVQQKEGCRLLKEYLLCALERYPQVHWKIGSSQLKSSIRLLPDAFTECREALQQETEERISFWTSPGEVPSRSCPGQTEDKLYWQQLARTGQTEILSELLQELIRQEEKKGSEFLHFRLYLLRLLHDLLGELPDDTSDAALFYVRLQYLFMKAVYWEKVLSSDSWEKLQQSVGDLFRQPQTDSSGNQYSRHIVSSLYYILAHYTEDIALETVASHNGISSFYLSRLFKQELNLTFLELLTAIRISKALDLLFTTNHSAQEISEECGYLNTSWFYKLFKKQTGMTIGELRNQLSHLPV
jgi:AraC-like DNA-binding protein